MRRPYGFVATAGRFVGDAAAGRAARPRAACRGARRAGRVGLRRQGVGPLGRQDAGDRQRAAGKAALQFVRPRRHLRPERAPAGAMPNCGSPTWTATSVEAQVIFGPIFQISTDDPALREACYGVYNDWLMEFCQAAPDRLIGVPMLPETPSGALKELQRLAAKGGVRQVTLMIANVNPKLDDRAWEAAVAGARRERDHPVLAYHRVRPEPEQPRQRQGRQRVREHEVLHGEFPRAVCRSVRLGHSRTPSAAEDGDGRGRHRLAAVADAGTRLPPLAAVGSARNSGPTRAARNSKPSRRNCSGGRSGRRSRKTM